MEFKTVHRRLIEIFPQIDERILLTVAIDHSKDADKAVEVVLSEIVPCLPINLMNTVAKTQDNNVSITFSYEDDPRTSSSGSIGLSVKSESSSNASTDERKFSGNILESSSNGCSITGCGTSKCSASCEESNDQGEAALTRTVTTTSGQVCNIDVLDGIIAEAKSNKKILMTVVEKVMNLMKEVEAQEKAAEQTKEEAKEKSILATEVKELQVRLLNLSEERDSSLSILAKMREILEARFAATEEMREKAMQERDESAKKALAEQEEAMMEKLVQESMILQIASEENSELREFLSDCGQMVDSLQGELSVVCQDVGKLKERFDQRVPIYQWIASSQTGYRLASSGSPSLKNSSLDIAPWPPHQVPKVSDKISSPPSMNTESTNGWIKPQSRDVLEDGRDPFDKDVELWGL